MDTKTVKTSTKELSMDDLYEEFKAAWDMYCAGNEDEKLNLWEFYTRKRDAYLIVLKRYRQLKAAESEMAH